MPQKMYGAFSPCWVCRETTYKVHEESLKDVEALVKTAPDPIERQNQIPR